VKILGLNHAADISKLAKEGIAIVHVCEGEGIAVVHVCEGERSIST
jgi:hypothetical protein